VLFDEKLRGRFEEKGISIGHGPDKEAIRKEWPGLREQLQKEASKGRMLITDSCEEIAAWSKTDPQELKATINEYNYSCEQGYNPVFAKDPQHLSPLLIPPFYVIKGGISFCDTIGGIRINEKMEVLDLKNTPIPGVYATGVITSGWEAESYCSELPRSAFGFAINSGRIAAENVISKVLKKS
jgi:fumarate reductase flavoprotein subunit